MIAKTFVTKSHLAIMAVLTVAISLWVSISFAQAANRTNMAKVNTAVGPMLAAKNVPVTKFLYQDMADLGIPQPCFDEAYELFKQYIFLTIDDNPELNPRFTIMCDINSVNANKSGFLGQALGSRVQPGGLRYLSFTNDETSFERFMVDPPRYKEKKSYQGVFKNLFKLASLNTTNAIPSTRTGIAGPSPIIASPISGKISISSGFGYRTHPVTGERGKFHNGIDIPIPVGTPLMASCGGRVSGNWHPAGGWQAFIQCDNPAGYRISYAHLQSKSPLIGKRVQQGQVIGSSGNTGRSTGPHLHYGVKKNGVFVNPRTIIGEPVDSIPLSPGQLAALGNNVASIDQALLGLSNYGGGALNLGDKESQYCSTSVNGKCPSGGINRGTAESLKQLGHISDAEPTR